MSRCRALLRVSLVGAAMWLSFWSLVAVAMALPSAPADAFQPASQCGCHAGLLEQWSTTMHSKAIKDPVFVYKREEADKATGGKLGGFCNSCHAPVAVMSGQTSPTAMSAQSAEGIGCDFCHQVTGTTEPLGNVSQTLAIDGTKRAQFHDAESPVHATAYSAYHESAEFCGACHNVDHPVNGMHLEATYTEWKASPYAAQGITCQDCHMTPGPGVVKPNPGTVAAGGPNRPHKYLMTFVGGNVAQGNAELATANLKAAAKLKMQAPDVIAKGSSGQVTVQVTNVGAGHYLPTGLTEVRQMWLEVSLLTEDGRKTSVGRRDFVTVLKDAKGRYPVELWDAVGIQSDDRIPPQGSVTATYTVEMPSDTSAEVEAVLYYRSLPDELAEKAGVENPVTTMASAKRVVWASNEARADGGTAEEADGSSSTPIFIGFAVLAVAGLAVGVVLWMRSRRGQADS